MDAEPGCETVTSVGKGPAVSRTDGFRSIGEAVADVLGDLLFRHRLRQLWRLGPRPIGELLLELAAISGRRTWLDQRLVDYAAIDGNTLDLAGARDWPHPILQLAAVRQP